MCIKGMCCNETNACANDASCVALLNCIAGCADATCAQNCSSQNPNGLTALQPLLTCTQTKCGTQCM
jgi:hypothetical protein